MVMRSFALVCLSLLVACKAPSPPLTSTPSLINYPALATRNPCEIAVLPVEDGTATQDASRHLEFMRQVLQRALPSRLYSPIAPQVVDAALVRQQPAAGESLMSPAYLKRVAGKAAEDAVLAVQVARWDESRLLTDMRVSFQFQVALVANDGELLWSGGHSGEVKAGGLNAAPRDRDGMARSCAEIALHDLLNYLARRRP